jgi:hypothetical protein
MAADKPVYKVIFLNQGQVYEVYARQIFQSELQGFIEVEEFLFGERSRVVVDPGEEKLKGEFGQVKRSFIPLHTVLRIDEVERQGVGKISRAEPGANIHPFPGPTIPGGRQDD